MSGRKVKFAYVNVDDDTRDDLIAQHTPNGELEFTPTVYIYGTDKHTPTEYTGSYGADGYNGLNEQITKYCDDNGFSNEGAVAYAAIAVEDIAEAPKQDLPESGLAPITGEGAESIEDLAILRLLGNAALGGQLDGFQGTGYSIPGFHGEGAGVGHGQILPYGQPQPQVQQVRVVQQPQQVQYGQQQ